MAGYRDSLIECTDTEVVIHRYQFLVGTKRIPYSAIRGIERAPLALLRGKGRIGGTANPGLWANLDWRRPRKSIALILDVGARVKPFLTPDDPDAALAAITAHTHVGAVRDLASGPII